MYSKYDKVVQQRFDTIADIEFEVEKSEECLEIERKQGLAKEKLMSFVPEELREQANELYELICMYETDKYNLNMTKVVCSIEFVKFFD